MSDIFKSNLSSWLQNATQQGIKERDKRRSEGKRDRSKLFVPIAYAVIVLVIIPIIAIQSWRQGRRLRKEAYSTHLNDNKDVECYR